jgi:hypothetical protein
MIVMLCVSLKAVTTEEWAAELGQLTECIKGIARSDDIDCEGVQVSLETEDTSGSSVNISGTISSGSSASGGSMECDIEGVSLVTGLCYQAYDGLSVPRYVSRDD